MKKRQKSWNLSLLGLLSGVLLGLVLAYLVVVKVAAERMEALASMTVGMQKKLVVSEVGISLSQLASSPLVKQVGSGSCLGPAEQVLQASSGLYAVIAVGDKDGQMVCAANPGAPQDLPSMREMLYYQRAVTAHELVAGEFAVSPITGKKVLHYAYPIRDEQDNFVGLVMAGIDLNWFGTPDLDTQLIASNTRILGVDRNGRLLYQYPTGGVELGDSVVPAKLVSAFLSRDSGHLVARSVWERYRVYGYRFLGEEAGDSAVVASTPIARYWWVFASLASILGLTGYLWGLSSANRTRQ